MSETGDSSSREREPLDLAREIARFLSEKKAEELRLLDLRHANPYFGYFMILTANSPLHLRALVRELEKNFGEYFPHRNSGYRTEDLDSGWVVVDLIDIVIHLFTPQERSYYNLEKLWGDADSIKCE